jgi:hypothetical protein
VAGGSATLAGNVQPGDFLVAVNGKSVIQPQLLDLNEVVSMISKAKAPRVLDFTSGDKTPRPSVQVGQPAAPAQVGAAVSPSTPDTAVDESEGVGPVSIQMVVPAILEGESYAAVRAEFDQAGDRCSLPLPLTAGIPQSRRMLSMGCSAPPAEVNVTGAMVLVKRGMCSFVTKARIARAAGAVGVIVVNDGVKPLVPMPAAHSELALIPVSTRVGLRCIMSKNILCSSQGVADGCAYLIFSWRACSHLSPTRTSFCVRSCMYSIYIALEYILCCKVALRHYCVY